MQLRKHFHRNYLYITGIICSSIWFMTLPGRFAALLAAMAIAALLIYYRCYRETAIFFLALLLGSTSTLYHTGKQKNPPPERFLSEVFSGIKVLHDKIWCSASFWLFAAISCRGAD